MWVGTVLVVCNNKNVKFFRKLILKVEEKYIMKKELKRSG